MGKTCSYDIAFYIMGTVLVLGGLLVQIVKDEGQTEPPVEPLAPKTSYIELANSQDNSSFSTSMRHSHIDMSAVVEEG